MSTSGRGPYRIESPNDERRAADTVEADPGSMISSTAGWLPGRVPGGNLNA